MVQLPNWRQRNGGISGAISTSTIPRPPNLTGTRVTKARRPCADGGAVQALFDGDIFDIPSPMCQPTVQSEQQGNP